MAKRRVASNSLKALEVEWRKYNKDMRQRHMHSSQFNSLDEYINYKHGRVKQTKSRFKEYVPSDIFVTDRNEAPSKPDTVGVAGKKTTNRYTGSLVKGIATMHKSNAVPVITQEHAEAIAKMRRN